MEAMGPALPPGFSSSRYEATDSSNPGEVNWETGAGGWENGYILVTAKQQTGNALHTHATEHRFEPRSRLACRGVVAFCNSGMSA